MSPRDEDNEPITEGSNEPGSTRKSPFRNAMFIVIGFGIATALTGLLTMGLIEFAQSMGWWEGSGR